eukprot:Rhum_TRINITY_DN14982_c22_g1::Rhum_TRINITY_DN14982_c22_g1_i1::g.131323::m.131323
MRTLLERAVRRVAVGGGSDGGHGVRVPGHPPRLVVGEVPDLQAAVLVSGHRHPFVPQVQECADLVVLLRQRPRPLQSCLPHRPAADGVVHRRRHEATVVRPSRVLRRVGVGVQLHAQHALCVPGVPLVRQRPLHREDLHGFQRRRHDHVPAAHGLHGHLCDAVPAARGGHKAVHARVPQAECAVGVRQHELLLRRRPHHRHEAAAGVLCVAQADERLYCGDVRQTHSVVVGARQHHVQRRHRQHTRDTEGPKVAHVRPHHPQLVDRHLLRVRVVRGDAAQHRQPAARVAYVHLPHRVLRNLRGKGPHARRPVVEDEQLPHDEPRVLQRCAALLRLPHLQRLVAAARQHDVAVRRKRRHRRVVSRDGLDASVAFDARSEHVPDLHRAVTAAGDDELVERGRVQHARDAADVPPDHGVVVQPALFAALQLPLYDLAVLASCEERLEAGNVHVAGEVGKLFGRTLADLVAGLDARLLVGNGVLLLHDDLHVGHSGSSHGCCRGCGGRCFLVGRGPIAGHTSFPFRISVCLCVCANEVQIL